MAVDKNLLQILCFYKRFDCFTRYVNIQHAKNIIRNVEANRFDFRGGKNCLIFKQYYILQTLRIEKALMVIVKKICYRLSYSMYEMHTQTEPN